MVSLKIGQMHADLIRLLPARNTKLRHRQAFTLVEMLVAMALVLFLMVFLTQAFVAGLEAFRQLKGIGDMEQKLRAASTVIRKDLLADHFEGKRRLSDPSFWVLGPPREGFFRIAQGSPSILEGTDGDGLASFSATNHILHFSVKLRGNSRGDFFSAYVDPTLSLNSSSLLSLGQQDSRYQDVPNTFNSQWAEVAYFLSLNGSTAGGTTPLFGLYRRQRLAVQNNSNINWGTGGVTPVPSAQLAAYTGVSSSNPTPLYTNIYFNSSSDLTIPQRRFGTNPNSSGYVPMTNLSGSPTGTDLLLTDVISFVVQVVSPDLPTPTDFSDLPAPGIFDTWSRVVDDLTTASPLGPPPLPIRISAVQIILRVWNLKTQQTREITIMQEM